MSHDHNTAAEEYNPQRDYHRAMNWFKWGGVVFILATLALALLIG